MTEPRIDRVFSDDELAASSDLAEQYGTTSAVHSDDYIFWYLYNYLEGLQDKKRTLEAYLQRGRDAAVFLQGVLNEFRPAQVLAGRRGTISILEFASGYGRVTRHFPVVMPNAEVVACDIHEKAVCFLRGLGFQALQSSSVPEELQTGRTFDVVFALSFFTHMPRPTWTRWLRSLIKQVSPDGLLVFTAHGEMNQRDGGIAGLELDGFFFTPNSEQKDLPGAEYGIAVTTFDYVYSQIEGSGLRLLQYKEAGRGLQDVYVLHRPREVDAYQPAARIVAERNAAMAEREAAVADRDASAAELAAVKAERDQVLATRDAIQRSISWKIASPLWRLETRGERKAARALK